MARYELWWLTLLVGIVEVWVAAAALARGITDLFLAFQLKKLQEGDRA